MDNETHKLLTEAMQQLDFMSQINLGSFQTNYPCVDELIEKIKSKLAEPEQFTKAGFSRDMLKKWIQAIELGGCYATPVILEMQSFLDLDDKFGVLPKKTSENYEKLPLYVETPKRESLKEFKILHLIMNESLDYRVAFYDGVKFAELIHGIT